MGFRNQATEEVKNSRSGNSNGGSSSTENELEQIDVDMGSIPFVKFNPTTLVSGTFPENEGNPIILFKNYDRLDELGDAANDENGRDMRYVSTRYLGLVLDDLSILTDDDEGMSEATFVETGEDDSTAYRAVNLADDNTSYKYDGAAVNVNGDVYDVEDTMTEIDGRAILVVDRTASVSVARKLDKNGAVLAGMDEETGQVNDGLVEYPVEDGQGIGEGRYARPLVELRDEFFGEEIGFMVTNRSEADDEDTGYVGQNTEPSNSDEHNDPTRASYAELVEQGEARDMMWYTVFDMETGDAIQPTTGETILDSYLQWTFDSEAGGLSEEERNFVERYLDAGMPVEEENIEKNATDNLDDPNVAGIIQAIRSEAE